VGKCWAIPFPRCSERPDLPIANLRFVLAEPAPAAITLRDAVTGIAAAGLVVDGAISKSTNPYNGPGFDSDAIVELMGHAGVVGWLAEYKPFGAKLGHIDVIKVEPLAARAS